MEAIDQEGMLTNSRVIKRRTPQIEHGSMGIIHAIVLHQTDSSSAASTFAAYRTGGNGAHFLIDKNGTIYQSASIKMRCHHIGKRIKSKCFELNDIRCSDKAIALAKAQKWSTQLSSIDAREREKPYPERFPINSDSIGIELVGMHLSSTEYEPLTPPQQSSLQWLIDQLYAMFRLTAQDIYRHPEVSYKNPGEAGSATWK